MPDDGEDDLVGVGVGQQRPLDEVGQGDSIGGLVGPLPHILPEHVGPVAGGVGVVGAIGRGVRLHQVEEGVIFARPIQHHQDGGVGVVGGSFGVVEHVHAVQRQVVVRAVVEQHQGVDGFWTGDRHRNALFERPFAAGRGGTVGDNRAVGNVAVYRGLVGDSHGLRGGDDAVVADFACAGAIGAAPGHAPFDVGEAGGQGVGQVEFGCGPAAGCHQAVGQGVAGAGGGRRDGFVKVDGGILAQPGAVGLTHTVEPGLEGFAVWLAQGRSTEAEGIQVGDARHFGGEFARQVRVAAQLQAPQVVQVADGVGEGAAQVVARKVQPRDLTAAALHTIPATGGFRFHPAFAVWPVGAVQRFIERDEQFAIILPDFGDVGAVELTHAHAVAARDIVCVGSHHNRIGTAVGRDKLDGVLVTFFLYLTPVPVQEKEPETVFGGITVVPTFLGETVVNIKQLDPIVFVGLYLKGIPVCVCIGPKVSAALNRAAQSVGSTNPQGGGICHMVVWLVGLRVPRSPGLASMGQHSDTVVSRHIVGMGHHPNIEGAWIICRQVYRGFDIQSIPVATILDQAIALRVKAFEPETVFGVITVFSTDSSQAVVNVEKLDYVAFRPLGLEAIPVFIGLLAVIGGVMRFNGAGQRVVFAWLNLKGIDTQVVRLEGRFVPVRARLAVLRENAQFIVSRDITTVTLNLHIEGAAGICDETGGSLNGAPSSILTILCSLFEIGVVDCWEETISVRSTITVSSTNGPQAFAYLKQFHPIGIARHRLKRKPVYVAGLADGGADGAVEADAVEHLGVFSRVVEALLVAVLVLVDGRGVRRRGVGRGEERQQARQ